MAVGLFIAAGMVNKLVAPNDKIIVGGSHDEELSYPVMPQQVPEPLLIGLAGIVPLVSVCALCEHLAEPGQGRRDLHINALMLVQSIGLSLFVTASAKKMAGRPRPNFYAMCGWQNTSTTAGCMADQAHVWEARQSFPSGHSSLAFSGLLFLTLLIMDKSSLMSKKRKLPASVPTSAWNLLAFFPTFVAIWVAITRVVDFWHNYDDILAGSAIGAACAMQAFAQRGRYTQAWFAERGVGGAPASDSMGLTGGADDASSEV